MLSLNSAMGGKQSWASMICDLPSAHLRSRRKRQCAYHRWAMGGARNGDSACGPCGRSYGRSAAGELSLRGRPRGRGDLQSLDAEGRQGRASLVHRIGREGRRFRRARRSGSRPASDCRSRSTTASRLAATRSARTTPASTTRTCTRTGFGFRRPGTATMCWSRSIQERRTATNMKFRPTILPAPIGTIRISTAPVSSRSGAAWRER